MTVGHRRCWRPAARTPAASARKTSRHDDYLGETGRTAGSGPRRRALLAETAARPVAARIGKLDETALGLLAAPVRVGERDVTSAAERLPREVAGEERDRFLGCIVARSGIECRVNG